MSHKEQHKFPSGFEPKTHDTDMKPELCNSGSGSPSYKTLGSMFENISAFVCSQCKNVFDSEEDLNCHLKIHSSTEGEPDVTMVESVDQQSPVLRRRLPKLDMCESCNKSFSERNKLADHLKTQSGEKPFRFNDCDKAFTQKSGLPYYMKRHNVDKPYQCTWCNKAFRSKSGIQYHMERHNVNKSHQCDKAFTWKGNLTIHSRIHGEKKSYQCSQCDKAFICKRKLVKHRTTHGRKKI